MVTLQLKQLTVPEGQRVVLTEVNWSEFEDILLELGEKRASRIAYCQNKLEILTPLPEHEYYKENIGTAIQDIAEVLEKDYESLGSTTWRKQAKMTGIESDNCFYFQNEPKIRGKLDYDLNQDPPPDLILEIDITNKSLNRFPLYAHLGIPELWRYGQGQLKVYLLGENEEYQESQQSLVFPNLPVQEIPSIINGYRNEGRRIIRKKIREWATQHHQQFDHS